MPDCVDRSNDHHSSHHSHTLKSQRTCDRFKTFLLGIFTLVFVWKIACPWSVHTKDTLRNERDSSQAFNPVALKQAHDLLNGRYSTDIAPEPEWLKHADHAAYPVRDITSSYQMCPDDEDINNWIRKRWFRWTETSFTEDHNVWQTAINDKLGGYLFARQMGVRVPRIEFCTGSGVQALADYRPPKGHGFVVKNLHGYSSNSVYVMETGFGGINRLGKKKWTLSQIQNDLEKLETSDIYVEELIEGMGIKGTAPDDYKFYMFNGKVGTINLYRNRGTERFCMATYDENWNRHDQFGCFLFASDKPKGNKTDPETGCYPVLEGASTPPDHRRFCSDLDPPKSFPKMLEIVKKLSERIGVFMRIDMFESADGEPVLGEFTPFSVKGGYNCVAKVTKSGCVDSCYLGRLWKESSLSNATYQEGYEKVADGKFVKRQLPPLEGGPITPTPGYLEGWLKLSGQEKCDRIRAFDEVHASGL
jgi:hypothetical protein